MPGSVEASEQRCAAAVRRCMASPEMRNKEAGGHALSTRDIGRGQRHGLSDRIQLEPMLTVWRPAGAQSMHEA
jgi:hypothetical protein